MSEKDENGKDVIDVDVIEETIGNVSNFFDAVSKPLESINPKLAEKAKQGASIGRKLAPLVGKVRGMAKTVSDATVTKPRPITPR